MRAQMRETYGRVRSAYGTGEAMTRRMDWDRVKRDQRALDGPDTTRSDQRHEWRVERFLQKTQNHESRGQQGREATRPLVETRVGERTPEGRHFPPRTRASKRRCPWCNAPHPGSRDHVLQIGAITLSFCRKRHRLWFLQACANMVASAEASLSNSGTHQTNQRHHQSSHASQSDSASGTPTSPRLEEKNPPSLPHVDASVTNKRTRRIRID